LAGVARADVEAVPEGHETHRLGSLAGARRTLAYFPPAQAVQVSDTGRPEPVA
jgi:hypothetical protein